MDQGLKHGNSHFASRGGMSIALRRCIGHCVASRIGCVLMTDAHHTTIASWVLRLAAALLGSKRECHRDAQMQLEESLHNLESNPLRFFTWNSVRCDATNANVWQKT